MAGPVARAVHAVATVTGASPDAAVPARAPVAARVAAVAQRVVVVAAQVPATVAAAEPRVTVAAERPATGVVERAVAAPAVSATPDRQGPSTTASDGAAAG